MTRMIVVVSLIAVQLGAAISNPCGTAAPSASTTGWCDTPLCKGLVGAGAGVAGLAAVGAIAGVLAQKKTTTTTPKKANAVITTAQPTLSIAIGTTGAIRAREGEDGSNWLLPLLLGLLLLCCLLGVIGYFCMNNKKRATKVKKSKKAPAPASKDIEVAAAPEAAPLMGGHWEQPMQTIPVTTTSSYVPTVAQSYAMAAPTYAAAPTMVETVAPTYAASAGLFGTTGYSMPGFATTTAPTVVETAAPTYAASAGLFGTAGYSMPGFATTAAPTVVETVAPTYAMPGFATTAAPTVVETVAPTVAPTYAVPGYPLV